MSIQEEFPSYEPASSRMSLISLVLASFGSGVHRSGDVAAKLGIQPGKVAPRRDNLIKKGMIYSPSYGEMEFTVPLFDEFMKRAMPW